MQIRISQAGSCPKQIQLEAWGVEGLPPWEGSERAFEEGRIHEASILEWAAKNVTGAPYTLSNQQMEVKATQWLIGHIDALATNMNGKICLFEAKCLSRRAFQELKEKGVQESHPQYYVQVQLYLHGLRNAGWAINVAYLVARNKETPKIRLWDHFYERIVYDASFVAEKINELSNLLGVIKEHREIPPPYSPETSWRCRSPWCPYSKHCWPDYQKAKVQAVDRSDLLPTVETYQELCEEIKALEEFRDEVKAKLLEEAANGPVKAGNWVVELKERRFERLDTKAARRILPADMLNQLITVSVSQILNVKEVI